MKTIVGVRLKKIGKVYYFDPGKYKLNVGDFVIVETALGEEYAEVAIANKEMPEDKIVQPLKPIKRIATPKDKKHYEENKRKEKEAFDIAIKNIKKHKLDMNLINVEYKFDGSKVLFYFTADGRIDFRDLVKDLAAIFKTRIELRQIGIRDEIKRMGGCGICGRELCCCAHLSNFETVSIKMAKEQNLSLTPSKISGACGRLMCCLKYEQEVYEEKLSRLPKVGAIVKTEEGEGTVESVETLKELLKVKIVQKDETKIKKFNIKDVQIIKDVEETDEDLEDSDLKELKKLEQLDKNEMKD
ncbi:MAG: stage 0 sporulation family protein [Clostridia bacterium]|jgi:cell fate regulator YaaT (PSP1 superfamily)|nr:stage 0 sporulation family protein [Clostridia bacterium]